MDKGNNILHLTPAEKQRIEALIDHLMFILDMASDDPDIEDDDPNDNPFEDIE